MPDPNHAEMIGRMALLTGWLNQARAAAHELRTEVASLRATVAALRKTIPADSPRVNQPPVIDNDA